MIKQNIKYPMVIIAFLALGLCIYIILGIGLMAYEDTCTPASGEFDSWTSMSVFDKSVVIALNIWNIVNVAAILYIGFIIYKRIKSKKVKFYGNNQSKKL